MPKFPLTSALLSGSASADDIDNLAWLLTGGPGNRTAYMAAAAKRAAARVSAPRLDTVAAPMLRMTDALFPLNCGSRFD